MEHVWFQGYQFRRISSDQIWIAFAPAMVDIQIAPDNPTKLL
jgi:hypothetical protein